MSLELPGLYVVLDRLVHQHDPRQLPAETPHAFVYFLTIHNKSSRTVTLLARKWIIKTKSGETLVVEGDKIVGQTPKLAPGESFSYNSYHVTGENCAAHGSFHGVDDEGNRIHVLIPEFKMVIP